MKYLFILLNLVIALNCSVNVVNAACPSGVCYIRPDGGTNTQCTGGSDASYDGSGTGESCALKHPFYALGWYTIGTTNPPTGGQAGIIIGGDDLIIKPGNYKMGYDAAQTFGCAGGSGSYNCLARPVPSGSSGNPTRIYGCSTSGCTGTFGTSYPELWSSGRTYQLFNLNGKSWIEIGWLNLTDRATCGYNHPILGCGPADDLELSGRDGINITGASNIKLKNLWIHGFYRYGLYGGGVNTLTVTDSKINTNAFAGWNADSCGNTTTCPEDGAISFTGSTAPTSTSSAMSIDWNGCVENPSSPTPNNTTGNAANNGCYTQGTGGYGDGIGTAATRGTWTFTRASLSHNTSDGIDMLYLNDKGLSGGSLTVTQSRMEGNVGNQVKGPNDMTLEDNLIIGNCGFFDGKAYEVSSAFTDCRAGGSTIVMAWRNNSLTNPKIYSNTITGNGALLLLLEGNSAACTSSIDILVKNNLFLGGRKFNSTANSIGFWYNSQIEKANTCQPQVISNNNACTGDFDSHGDCTTNNTTNGYQMSSTDSVYTATATNVFTGTINQGPSTFYSGTDYMDQLTIKSGSIARDIADESLAGDDAVDFNNFNRGASWDAGGLEFGTTSTTTPAVCGDNTTDASLGEICDGTDLNNQTCVTLGYVSGTLTCASNCLSYDTSGCVTNPCGNGVIDSLEECDGVNLNGQTCQSRGFSSGTLSCSSCLFVTSACITIICGDGVVNQGEECDDGNLTEGDGCSSVCENEISGLEKFLTWAETDPSSNFAVRTHKMTVTGLDNNTNAFLRKDFGASYFDNFTHTFGVVVNGCSDNGAGVEGEAAVWAISSAAYSSLDDLEAAQDGIVLSLTCLSNSAQYTWRLYGY